MSLCCNELSLEKKIAKEVTKNNITTYICEDDRSTYPCDLYESRLFAFFFFIFVMFVCVVSMIIFCIKCRKPREKIVKEKKQVKHRGSTEMTEL